MEQSIQPEKDVVVPQPESYRHNERGVGACSKVSTLGATRVPTNPVWAADWDKGPNTAALEAYDATSAASS